MNKRLVPLACAAAGFFGAALLAMGAAAQDHKSFTMGYSVGFLTDPFQAIQVDLTMAEAKKAGLQPCRSPTPTATPASRSPTSTT